MKKISYVLLALLLVLSIGLGGCASKSGPGVSEASDAAVSEESGKKVIFELTNQVLPFPNNPPYNYQALILLGSGQSFQKGETVTMEITATSDIDIALLKTALIDQGTSGSEWINFTNYYEIYSSISAGKKFSFSYDLPVDISASNENLKIALFTEYNAVDSQPTLTIKSLTLTK